MWGDQSNWPIRTIENTLMLPESKVKIMSKKMVFQNNVGEVGKNSITHHNSGDDLPTLGVIRTYFIPKQRFITIGNTFVK